MQAAVDSMGKQDIDFIMWTGDNPPHNLWNQTHESHMEHIRIVGDALNNTFTPKGVPIYPVLGNHGCYPPNNFEFGHEEWLTNFIADEWAHWLTPKAQEQIR
jgi:sphingomyelin phosphodiesterase